MESENREFRRGEIYYADLNPIFGHEQGGYRPVLILQNDYGNFYSPTVIVTSATGRVSKKPRQPTHVVFPDIEGLPRPSVFQLENLRTVDKRRLGEWVGKLTDEQMEKIDAALRVSLHLSENDYLPTEVEAP